MLSAGGVTKFEHQRAVKSKFHFHQLYIIKKNPIKLKAKEKPHSHLSKEKKHFTFAVAREREEGISFIPQSNPIHG
jgi:hypothetical protein